MCDVLALLLVLVVCVAGTCTPPAFGPGCTLNADTDDVGFGVTVGCAAACGLGGTCIDDVCVCHAGYTLGEAGTCVAETPGCGCGPDSMCGTDGVCYVGGAWPNTSFSDVTADVAVQGTVVGSPSQTGSAVESTLAIMGTSLSVVVVLGVILFVVGVKI